MKLSDYIPRGMVDYVRLIRNKKRFPGCVIMSPHIKEDVLLGENVSISRDVYLDNGVVIGKQSYIHNGTMIISGRIGNFCSIAFNCQIGMWEHPTNYISTSPKTYASANVFGFKPIWKHEKAPIIGNDVWIGSNVVILRGVTIGNGAIIGAGAIVTKNIPPYAIVVGSPAEVIRYRFNDDTIKFLLDYKWWDLPLEKLRELREFFEEGQNGIMKLKETEAQSYKRDSWV